MNSNIIQIYYLCIYTFRFPFLSLRCYRYLGQPLNVAPVLDTPEWLDRISIYVYCAQLHCLSNFHLPFPPPSHPLAIWQHFHSIHECDDHFSVSRRPTVRFDPVANHFRFAVIANFSPALRLHRVSMLFVCPRPSFDCFSIPICQCVPIVRQLCA